MLWLVLSEESNPDAMLPNMEPAVNQSIVTQYWSDVDQPSVTVGQHQINIRPMVCVSQDFTCM